MLVERALKIEDVELVLGTPELLQVVYRGQPKFKQVAKRLLGVVHAAAELEDALEAVKAEDPDPAPVAAKVAPDNNDLQLAVVTPVNLRKKQQPSGASPKSATKPPSPSKQKHRAKDDSEDDDDAMLPAVLADIKSEAMFYDKSTKRTIRFAFRLGWAVTKFFGGFMVLALAITALSTPSVLLRGTAALLKQFPHLLWGILNEIGLELWSQLLPGPAGPHCPDSCNFALPASWETPTNRSSDRVPHQHLGQEARTGEHSFPPSAPVSADWSAISAVFSTAALLLAAQKQ